MRRLRFCRDDASKRAPPPRDMRRLFREVMMLKSLLLSVYHPIAVCVFVCDWEW